MPSVTVNRSTLTRLIGKEYTTEEINDLTFDFGIELDETYEEEGQMKFKFDVPANRYDLLCVEGLAAALRAYTGLETAKDIVFEDSEITVKKERTHERQAIACAVIREVKFDKDSYDSFISYQEKLHSSIGRNRSLVAVGAHDLSKISGEIVYKSMDLKDICFVPLQLGSVSGSKPVNGTELVAHFQNEKQILKYFGLLTDPQKAVVFMCGPDVMSVPPIINSEKTRISQQTTDIFIEVTGTDMSRVNTVLKHIIYNFQGSRVERVRIETSDGEIQTPLVDKKRYVIGKKKINDRLNLSLDGTEIKRLLEKMMYEVVDGSDSVTVDVCDCRSDILHVCDILEDIAVAYGFNNFRIEYPSICTVGSETRMGKFTDKLRQEISLAGYNEVLTLTLTSGTENIVDSDRAVILSNPKSKDYEVVRTSLLPGILKAIASNLHTRIPIKVFEIADVVVLDQQSEVGARNERRACAVIAANTSHLEDVQGPLSLLLEKCGIRNYRYECSSASWYLDNQNARVVVGGECIGHVGVLHPHVNRQFGIPYAASCFEINIDKLYKLFSQ